MVLTGGGGAVAPMVLARPNKIGALARMWSEATEGNPKEQSGW